MLLDPDDLETITVHNELYYDIVGKLNTRLPIEQNAQIQIYAWKLFPNRDVTYKTALFAKLEHTLNQNFPNLSFRIDASSYQSYFYISATFTIFNALPMSHY